MWATIFLPLIPPVLVRPHGLSPSTAGRTIAWRLFAPGTPHGALRVLALVGFLVGTLVLAMQESSSRLSCKCLQSIVKSELRCKGRKSLCPMASEAWEA
jgi:hypothetical protein